MINTAFKQQSDLLRGSIDRGANRDLKLQEDMEEVKTELKGVNHRLDKLEVTQQGTNERLDKLIQGENEVCFQ